MPLTPDEVRALSPEFSRAASRVRACLTSVTARPLITLRLQPPHIVVVMQAGFLSLHAFERRLDVADVDALNETGLRGVLQQTIDQGDRLLIRRTMTEVIHRGRAMHMTVGDLLGTDVPL